MPKHMVGIALVVLLVVGGVHGAATQAAAATTAGQAAAGGGAVGGLDTPDVEARVDELQSQLLKAAAAGDVAALHATGMGCAGIMASGIAEDVDKPTGRRLGAVVVDSSVNQDGKSALFLAAEHNQVRAVKYLLTHGADMEAVADNGDTALLAATRASSTDAARALVLRGANVNAVNEQTGDTAVLVAAAAANVELGELLVSKGARVEEHHVPVLRETALCFPAPSHQFHNLRRVCGHRTGRHARTWRGPDADGEVPGDADADGADSATESVPSVRE